MKYTKKEFAVNRCNNCIHKNNCKDRYKYLNYCDRYYNINVYNKEKRYKHNKTHSSGVTPY